MRLQEIGLKTGTDKSAHTYKNISYLDIYERYFNKIKNDVKVFVEIGIFNGKSLKMWKEYFPNAIIYGIDINPINILFGEFAFAEFISFPPIDYCLCKFWLNG